MSKNDRDFVTERIKIENAELLFRNFEGRPNKFNPAGRRNFCVKLDDETAERLKKDKWNVRYLKPLHADDEEPQPYMQVRVAYGKSRPPKVVIINSAGKSYLSEKNIHMLDWAEFEKVDLLITPYNWEVGGDAGVSGYLKTMYATLREDELESKYAQMDESYDLPEEDV